MKLSMEEVQNLYDIIETQRQEIEKLKATLVDWKYEVKCHIDEVVARDKEIARLKAQVDTLSAQRKSC